MGSDRMRRFAKGRNRRRWNLVGQDGMDGTGWNGTGWDGQDEAAQDRFESRMGELDGWMGDTVLGRGSAC